MSSKAVKLKSGNWRCRAYYTDEFGNYKTKSFTAETKKAAEIAAANFLVEYEHASKPENITLGELADRFIDSRSNLLSPSTIAGYRKIRTTAFCELTGCRIGLLTHQMYQKAVNDYSKCHAYKTVLSAHSFYKTVLEENGVTVAQNIKLPPKTKATIQIPTHEEVASFLENITDSQLRLYCLFAITLGLRKSEILALQWKDVQGNRLVVNKARVKDEFGEYVLKSPKTFEGSRELHMRPALLRFLEEPGAPGEFIISAKPDAIDSLYKRTKTKYNFPYNFHALRHYFASIMLQSGIPNKYAKERMGHATEDMLQNVYQHTFRSKQEEYDLLLDQFFEDTLPK